ncbi:MAG: 3-deoxy-8-phosphooctulonate synthase [Candidatus Aminicenantes bacterium]|nr:3-deoxy-8-phosphooctulonate synthase [Candidatus Aminicenantes bacterium]
MPTASKEVVLGPAVKAGGRNPLFLIAGPCVIESRDHALRLASELAAVTRELGVPLVFKASFDKANRSSLRSYRGPGLEEGLKILEAVRGECGVPVLSDVHETGQVARAAEVLDVLQIPAFLCRQTDLLIAAARTGKPLNLKKGQFLAPGDMRHAVDKVIAGGNDRILLTERGTSFGYHDLVFDIRSIPILKSLGFPVVLDASHSVQRPGGMGEASGGDAEFIPLLARAGVSAGADGLFIEVHEAPEKALSDGRNSLRLSGLEPLLKSALAVRRAVENTERS